MRKLRSKLPASESAVLELWKKEGTLSEQKAIEHFLGFPKVIPRL